MVHHYWNRDCSPMVRRGMNVVARTILCDLHQNYVRHRSWFQKLDYFIVIMLFFCTKNEKVGKAKSVCDVVNMTKRRQ